MFRVIPAIDLKDGKVVRLRQGRESEITFTASDPLSIAEMWVGKGARALHVVDLSGAFEGKLRHEAIIAEIIQLGVEVQVGGGIRELVVAERLLELGAARVILGTIAVEKQNEVREFAESWEERIMIALDARKDRVAVRGWKKVSDFTAIQLAQIYDDLRVSFLYTNIDVEGLVSGIERDKIAKIVSTLRNPVYVAGGISSIEDVRFVKSCGAAGAVIGSALYTGKLKFEDVLKVEHEEVQQKDG